MAEKVPGAALWNMGPLNVLHGSKLILNDQGCLFDSFIRECVSRGAAGAQTRRSLGHHLLHPLILRLLVLCAPTVLRPRALQDAPAPADPNS